MFVFFSQFRTRSQLKAWRKKRRQHPGCRTSHPPLFASWPRPSWMVARRRVRCLKRWETRVGWGNFDHEKHGKTQTPRMFLDVSGIWHRCLGRRKKRDIFTCCDLNSLQSERYLQTYHPSRLPTQPKGLPDCPCLHSCSDAVGRLWTELQSWVQILQKKSESIQLWKER